MADTKKLVLVVESTSALAPHWRTIFSGYLDKIIRTFCGDEHQTPDTPIAELTLVSFNARESDTNLAQRSSWTTDVEVFMEWLSALKFSDGDLSYDHAAIAEGLAEVLVMFPSVHGNQNLQRHCILVAASNPYPLPSPVYIPPDYLGMRIENHSSDAETVAKYFKQCLISLSVICPHQLPKLRAIYNAAKWNPLERDLTIDIVKDPDHLVLISQSFMEARAALSQPQITKLPSDGQSPIMDLTQEEDSSPPTFVGNIPDPDTIKEAAAQTSSEITWEDIMSWYDDIVQLDPTPPIVVVPTEATAVTSVVQPKRGISGILNNLSHSRLLGPGNPDISNMITRACMPLTSTSTSSGQAESATLPDYVATNLGPAQQTSNALELSYLAKLWEGDLCTVDRKGQPVLIARLQGYRNKKDSNQSLAKDWPSTMQIDRLIPEAEIRTELMNYTGKVDFLAFEAKNEHFFLKRMQLNKLCMLIMLPSQLLTLFISAANETTFVGKVVDKETVRYKPTHQEQQQGQAPWQGQQSMSSPGVI